MTARLLLGTHIHPASGETAARQERASRALLELRDVELVNLQFRDRQALVTFDGFETACVLERDSVEISGKDGVRKPVASELFDRLAEEAARRGIRYFGFTNSDIQISQRAVERGIETGRQCAIFSRSDFKGTPESATAVLLTGTDFFVVECDWWKRHRRRFQPYVIGESGWDNVYTSQLLCHSDGLLHNREPLIFHELHEPSWLESPFARYNGYLGVWDAPYFSLWCGYLHGLEALRARNAPKSEELAWQRTAFRWPPPPLERLKHGLRLARAWARHLVAE